MAGVAAGGVSVNETGEKAGVLTGEEGVVAAEEELRKQDVIVCLLS